MKTLRSQYRNQKIIFKFLFFCFLIDSSHRVPDTSNPSPNNTALRLSSSGYEVVSLTTEHKVTNPIEQERLKKLGVEIYEKQTRLNGLQNETEIYLYI